jgi:hypothetical protein
VLIWLVAALGVRGRHRGARTGIAA